MKAVVILWFIVLLMHIVLKLAVQIWTSASIKNHLAALHDEYPIPILIAGFIYIVTIGISIVATLLFLFSL